jgi:hypothetical protein
VASLGALPAFNNWAARSYFTAQFTVTLAHSISATVSEPSNVPWANKQDSGGTFIAAMPLKYSDAISQTMELN